MAVIFDIQRFSLHDGPGIRTTVFLKGCPLACLWCQNPESRKKKPEMAFYAERCRQCLACREACGQGAISDAPERRIDFSRCTACGKCAEICPEEALRLIGREIEVAEAAEEIAKDRDFYESSGGGATLSGGEPLSQPGFVKSLSIRLKEMGIETAVETCGQFSFSAAAPALAHVGLVLFDLKAMDPGLHKRLTGKANRTILDNFSRLCREGANLTPRMPVVPGLNDHEENLRATAEFLKKNGKKDLVLLSYHRMGEAKLARIGSGREPLGLAADPEKTERAQRIFRKEGIHASVQD